jgi:hypothetical protein
MTPLHSVLESAFGCHHRQRRAAFTIKQRTYQVCLNCGREFDYSGALMHSIQSSVTDSPLAPLSSNHVRQTMLRQTVVGEMKSR